MTKLQRGTRVRLIHTTDIYTQLPRGSEGAVILTDDMGTIHVKWDNGSSLGLIAGEDDWEVLGEVPVHA